MNQTMAQKRGTYTLARRLGFDIGCTDNVYDFPVAYLKYDAEPRCAWLFCCINCGCIKTDISRRHTADETKGKVELDVQRKPREMIN